MCQTYETHRSQLSLRWRWRHFELLLRFGGRRIIFRQVVQRWEWILSIYPRRTRSKSHSFQLTRCESWRKFLWTFDRPRNPKVISFYKNNFWFLKVIALHVKISWISLSYIYGRRHDFTENSSKQLFKISPYYCIFTGNSSNLSFSRKNPSKQNTHFYFLSCIFTEKLGKSTNKRYIFILLFFLYF